MPNIAAAGISAGASVVNNLITQSFAEHNRKRNFYYNEKAADNADKRQRQQYIDLYSPQALIEQYKAAGLSPSLMMSGGAPAVGQSSAQGNQSAGIQGPYPSSSPIDPVAMAQIANINANTEKTKAETSNIEQKTIGQQLDNYITASNVNETLEQAKLTTANLAAQLQQIIAETANIQWETNFNELTKNDQWQALKNKNTLMLEQVLTEQTNRKLTDREREHYDTIFDKWQMEIYQKFTELDIKSWEVEYQNRWFQSQAQYLENQINLGKDRLSFDKEYFEFDKKKWQQQRNLERWRIGTQTVTDIAKIAVFGTAAFVSGGTGAIAGGMLSIPANSAVNFQ